VATDDATSAATSQPPRWPTSHCHPGWTPAQTAALELSALVVGEWPLGELLSRVAKLAKTCVPAADEVSVLLLDEGGGGHRVAFTGRLAASLDERQYPAGFGPGIQAASAGHVVRIQDTSSDTTYPTFAAIAARQGVANTVSLGLRLPNGVKAGITVYRFAAPALDEHDVEMLQVFGVHAGVVMLNHLLFTAATTRTTEIAGAMQSRAVIEQAKGVLLARLHCNPEEAFQDLAKQSQRTNRKLRDVAAEVVEDAQH